MSLKNKKEFKSLLERLHELIRSDKDELEEGEEIRDRLDYLHDNMTKKEVEECRKYSAVLYEKYEKEQMNSDNEQKH